MAPACFRIGTRIRTASGERCVEQSRAGDAVLTASGAYHPVVWVGHRRVDACRHKAPASVWPVRIACDAFAPEGQIRDLCLSPDHAVFVDAMLIPVKCLINGTTIAQLPVKEVNYYHVELDRHDVLLAEDLPVESYLETGDRGTFTNGGGAIVLHPEFAARIWEAEVCAPLVVAGPALANVRAALDARAELLQPVSHDQAAEAIAVAKRRA